MTSSSNSPRNLSSLSTELDDVRNAMKRLLMNGGGVEPAKPYACRAARRKEEAAAHRKDTIAVPYERARCEDDRRDKGRRGDCRAPTVTPGLRTSAIAKAAETPPTSAQNRLMRLQRAGKIERGEDEGWRAAIPPN